MKNRFLVESIAFTLITKKENNEIYVLLQRRYKTETLNGEYDVSSSGHLENNETSIQAAIRESYEELGIEIKKKDLKFLAAINAKYSDKQYVSIAFHTEKYIGKPFIKEPDKCDELKWFKINELPSNISKHAKLIIESYLSQNHYITIGFDN